MEAVAKLPVNVSEEPVLLSVPVTDEDIVPKALIITSFVVTS